MIPTFILGGDSSVSLGNSFICPIDYTPQQSFFANLRTSILWAISYNEDVICCAYNPQKPIEGIVEQLFNIIPELATEGVYLLYTEAEYGDYIAFDSCLRVVSDIRFVGSFVMIRPLFQFALSILDELLKSQEGLSWLDFLQLLSPHAFLLESTSIANDIQSKIHVISPFRNAANYIEECLASIEVQQYDNYHVYFIDDCSDDKGADLIPNNNKRISKIVNKERKYALHNIIEVLEHADIQDNDIVCLLDSDDKLAHKFVFPILNAVYAIENLLFTHGCMRYYGEYRRFGTTYTREEYTNLRNSAWKVGHIRTFRYRLFCEYLRQDSTYSHLKDGYGKILRMPYDMALFFPLMELAGYENIRFIPTLLYEYRTHENNDHTINRREQYEGELLIRAKRPLPKTF